MVVSGGLKKVATLMMESGNFGCSGCVCYMKEDLWESERKCVLQ